MEQKKSHSKNILSNFFMIKDFDGDAPTDKAIKFSINYNNTLFIEYDTPKSIRYASEKNKHDAIILQPAEIDSNTLYFCHLPSEIKTRCEFEKLILKFLPNKTLKIKAYIAEKVFSVTFESKKDADRIATFIPQIEFEANDLESNDELDDEDNQFYKCHIFVGGSWFDMPIVRFTNIPIDMPQKKFQNQKLLRNAVFCQFQKNKTSNKQKTFQNINVIANSVKNANEIIKHYNFGSYKNEMAYVNWFVDNEVLEKLEKYKIKVYPNKNDDLSKLNETKFFEKMSNYGRVFSVTLCRNNKSSNEENSNDDDSDYDINSPDEDSENENQNDREKNQNEDRNKDGPISFGNVIFVNKDDIKNVQKDYHIEYWFAGGMVYNFPFETTEEEVSEYLSAFSNKILSVELRNLNQIQKDNKILPYFFITFDTVDSLEEVRLYIDDHPYTMKGDKGKMQPFIIPREKNLPSTIQKYNLHRDLLLKNNTILVENLTSECSSSGLIDLFASYGTIMFIKIDEKKEDSKITANLTFSDESEMNAAIDGINDAVYNSNQLKVTQYISPSDDNSNSNSNRKKKKKKGKSSNEEGNNISITINSGNKNAIEITRDTKKKNINVVYRSSSQSQANPNAFQKKKSGNNNSNYGNNNNFKNKKNRKEKGDDDDNDADNNNQRNYSRGGKNQGNSRGGKLENRGGRGARGKSYPYRRSRGTFLKNNHNERKSSNVSDDDFDVYSANDDIWYEDDDEF